MFEGQEVWKINFGRTLAELKRKKVKFGLVVAELNGKAASFFPQFVSFLALALHKLNDPGASQD